ncbi:MAG TPA: retropepsin-like aspartic protease [Burkholderiales bacterium]|nr:retropepsin-like aspartic protease [Burkholderiales bacterium]
MKVIALVDSGADCSLMDVSYAQVLGLKRADAKVTRAATAGGTTVRILRWPVKKLEIQFENDRFPFEGAFVEFPKNADPVNLLGRKDFFQRYMVQFWDAAEMMNIDTSPDFPRPAP